MEDFYVQTHTISAFALIFTLVPKYIKDKLHLPETFSSLLFGIFAGKLVPQITKVIQRSLFFICTSDFIYSDYERCTFSIKGFASKISSSTTALVLVSGCIKCLFTIGVLCLFKSLDLSECWCLASSLTSTDPILCSCVLKSCLKMLNKLRTLQLVESGINVGLGTILLTTSG